MADQSPGFLLLFYYGSIEHVPEVKLGSFRTDGKGVVDLTVVYSKMQVVRLGESVADLAISGLDSDDARSGIERNCLGRPETSWLLASVASNTT